MSGKALIIIAVVGIVAILGKWAMDSSTFGEMLIYTRDHIEVVTTEDDVITGAQIKKTTRTPKYGLGLLDQTFPFGALPMCGAWFFLGAFGFYQTRKNQKSS
ncbi:MAG: hypothetical protein JNL32_12185 [Candidatus Kapabacteria bacterium]|nr:hypothetical protein [Candidatus Kapabacteria bacterium]